MILKKSKSQINLAIVTTEPFPIGMAATNRIISWTRVLSNNNVSVKVYIIKPTEREDKILNTDSKGIYHSIHFEYVNKTTIWPSKRHKFYRFWIIWIGYLNMIRSLIKDRPEKVVTYTSNFAIKFILLILRKFLRYNLIAEETEYPRFYKQKHSKVYEHFYLALYKYYDGVLVITKELNTYYSSIKAKNVFVLPMTVDGSRFDIQQNHTKENYFAYVGGSGGFVRDGVFDIVKGFKIFSDTYPNYKLLIIGPINKDGNVFKSLCKFIEENGLSEKVDFPGSKSSDDIPIILSKATGLILAPPKDFESGGFPTKLGEFLASGTPVICSRVSDISLYLNFSNSFLVEPQDIRAISLAMQKIIADPVESYQIGMNGKMLANSVFNAESYIPEILEYFKFHRNV